MPNTRSRRFRASLLCVALAVGCVSGSKEISEREKRELARFVLDAGPPSIKHPVEIDYDGKATLLGYEITPTGSVERGGRVKITMYWRSDRQIEPGWNLFTHVVDGSGERILNVDNVGPLRRWHGSVQALGPSSWKPGKVYVDTQEFSLPKEIKSNRVQILTGIWKGEDRLKIVRGPHDRGNRGIVATLSVSGSAADKALRNTRTPLLRVNKLEKGLEPKIDGVLDDRVWQDAASTGPFVNVSTGQPNTDFPVNGSAKLLWNERGMFIAFEVKDPDVVGGFDPKQKDPHLWTKDTVEIMIDPHGDGDNKDYFEIQVNPQNLVFDSRFDSYNQPRQEPNGPFGHEDWSSGLVSAVQVQGTLDQPGDRDEGYVVEAFIPWKSFAPIVKGPPELGEVWRMNFYAMQNNGGVAWSPILGQGNFHKASRFGRIVWSARGAEPPETQAGVQHEAKGGPKTMVPSSPKRD